MKRSSAARFALTGTILLLIAFVCFRLIYINVHRQTFEQITKKISSIQAQIYENDSLVQDITDASEIEALNTVLSNYVYTEYKSFFKPSKQSLTQNKLTVYYDDASVSFTFSADGYVLVNDKLRNVEGSRGQEIYQKLYSICHPAAVTE